MGLCWNVNHGKPLGRRGRSARRNHGTGGGTMATAAVVAPPAARSVTMRSASFYQQIVDITTLPPAERYMRLTALHEGALADYLATLCAITPPRARRLSADGRTLGQVVGHIAEWDRFTL